MDRRSFLAACAAAGTLAAAPGFACHAPQTGRKPVVGLVMKSLANEFFKDMQEGAVRHAQEPAAT